MHFFENSPLLSDTGRYVPRFVVYIVLRVQPKADDMAAFNLQKDQPGGRKTFKAYIWKLEKAAYEQSNG